MVETDLLAQVCAEIEQRMVELRPLLDEYERLLAANDALDSFEAAPTDDGAPELPPRPAPSRRRARGQRGSAAGAIKLVASAPPEPVTPAPEPEPAPSVPRTPREPRILAGMPSLRTQPGLSALPPAPAKSTPIAVEAPPAIPEPVVEEFEPEPELERRPASPSEVRQAIIAALEHGSHTLSELVMVTAMSTPEIRAAVSQLARQRKVTRVKREGDGKSAFALPASSAQG
jgi:hypothetical protein